MRNGWSEASQVTTPLVARGELVAVARRRHAARPQGEELPACRPAHARRPRAARPGRGASEGAHLARRGDRAPLEGRAPHISPYLRAPLAGRANSSPAHDTRPRHVHDTPTTRPRHAHDTPTTRPRHVHDMSTTCPRHVHVCQASQLIAGTRAPPTRAEAALRCAAPFARSTPRQGAPAASGASSRSPAAASTCCSSRSTGLSTPRSCESSTRGVRGRRRRRTRRRRKPPTPRTPPVGRRGGAARRGRGREGRGRAGWRWRR